MSILSIAKNLNLSFIKKYIYIFFKPRYAETSSSIAYFQTARPEPASMFKYIIYYCNIYSSDFSPLKIRLIMTDTQKFLGKSRNLLKNFLIILNLCFIIYLITSYFINIYYNEFLSCQICQ